MRKAFGIIELLFVSVIIMVLYFTMLKPHGNKNPFDDGRSLQTKQQMAEEKIQEIQKMKEMNEQIQKNLEKQY